MTTDPKKPEAEETATEIVSIKGFNLDWTCRDGIKPLVWYTLGVDGEPVEAI